MHQLETASSTLDRLFQSAATFLSSSESTKRLSNGLKLEIYGLYKLVTAGPRPPPPRPSFFDQVGRAKWDSWDTLGKKWIDELGVVRKEDIQKRYIEVAQSLGWVIDWDLGENARLSNDSESIDLEHLDEDDGSQPRFQDNQSSGTSTKVSTLVPTDPHDSSTSQFHDLAVNGRLDALAGYLKAHPMFDLNCRNVDGYTALHLASDRGHGDVVKFLLFAKADATLKDADGCTAKDLAELVGHENIVNCLNDVVKADIESNDL